MYFLYLFMIISCNTLLTNDKVHTIPVDTVKIIKPIPITDKIIEVDVAPMITIVSTDSKIVLRVIYFYISFSICYFCL